MKLLILLSTLGLAMSLTDKEVREIEEYGHWYGYSGACYNVKVEDDGGDNYVISSNGIPNHPVYDTNPNDVQEQAYNYQVPKNPIIAASPSCVPMGQIGFAINGVPFYNPLSALQVNAVQGSGAETFDGCGGHPAMMGRYHYHMLPSLDCIFHDNIIPDNGNGTLIGVALDGFPIYYWKEATQLDYFEDLLDECHGTSKLGGTYRYYITQHYPYIIGCYKGTPSPDANPPTACPDFDVKKNVLCNCPLGAGGPNAPGASGGPPPPRNRRQTNAAAEWLTRDDTTDSDCMNKFDCRTTLSEHLWCHNVDIEPAYCTTGQPTNICSGNSNQQPPQSGSNGQLTPQSGSNGQLPPQSGSNGQLPPQSGSNGQLPPQSGSNGQQPPQPGSNGQQPPQPGSNGQQPPQSGSNGQQPPQPGSNGQQQQQQPPQSGSNGQQRPQQPPRYGQQQPQSGQGQPPFGQGPFRQGRPQGRGRGRPMRRGNVEEEKVELARSLRALLRRMHKK